MPMTLEQFTSYVTNYSVDMERSWLALDGEGVLGLGMLGVRPGRCWITRLTVLPAARRKGIGEFLTRKLLDEARAAGIGLAILEFIQGNQSAGGLFDKLGFTPTRSLLVLRRPAGPPAAAPVGEAHWLASRIAYDLLESVSARLPWTNEVETYQTAGDGRALRVALPDGSRGWMVYRRQSNLLSHFVMETEAGAPEMVCAALLNHLYQRYPRMGSYVENVPIDDPHAPGMARQGFFESFRRTEMHLKLEVN
jgi:hypothetical protein